LFCIKVVCSKKKKTAAAAATTVRVCCYVHVSVSLSVLLDFPHNQDTCSLPVPQTLYHIPPSSQMFLFITQHQPMRSDVACALFWSKE
jgi:hypothetical protein